MTSNKEEIISKSCRSSRTTRRCERCSREQGNAFFIVLLGVVLFAALMMTFSRGARQGGENISDKQAQLAATDILSYAQKIERAVGYIRSKRISENDISFYNAFVAGYQHGVPQYSSHQIFHPDGGHISWMAPTDSMNDGTAWVFSGDNAVDGLGSAGDATDAELLAILPNVRLSVCEEINKALGITGIPQENNDSSVAPFTGTFATTQTIKEDGAGIALNEQQSACFEGDTGGTPGPGTYHFYHVLIQRP